MLCTCATYGNPSATYGNPGTTYRDAGATYRSATYRSATYRDATRWKRRKRLTPLKNPGSLRPWLALTAFGTWSHPPY